MRKFEVYYGDVLVGVLQISEREEYSYKVDESFSQNNFNKDLFPPQLLTEQIEFGQKIPLFQVRIEANERFSNLPIGFHTDKVYLVEVKI